MRITLRDVAAGYGPRNVLQGISLDLRAGEFVGLIGPNGAGKSTLLRVITRFLPPRSGQLLYDGEPAVGLPAREVARRIAFVPQSEPTLFEFTVRDVVLMGRHPYVRAMAGETEQDYGAAVRAMAATDTLQLADRPVTGLSGGEHQRVLIARALAQEAPLLVLDEPTAHLDVTHQTELLTLARRQTDEQQVTVLAALHDLNLAAEFCDRLVLLAGGRIVADGPPDAVLTPEHLGDVYGASLRVGRSPASGKPFVFPLPPAADRLEGETRRVHVVCGGGTGAAVLSGLLRRGVAVTAGVLNRLDSDEEAAMALGIEHVTEAPFSRIGPDARAACEALMRQADALVITDLPFGNGNLANLEMAAAQQAEGKPVYLIGETPIADRDFTEGAATRLWRRLVEDGARVTPDMGALENALLQRAPGVVP